MTSTSRLEQSIYTALSLYQNQRYLLPYQRSERGIAARLYEAGLSYAETLGYFTTEEPIFHVGRGRSIIGEVDTDARILYVKPQRIASKALVCIHELAHVHVSCNPKLEYLILFEECEEVLVELIAATVCDTFGLYKWNQAMRYIATRDHDRILEKNYYQQQFKQITRRVFRGVSQFY